MAKAAGLDSDAITLTRFILTEQRKHPAASGDFTLLMSSIALACKATAVAVKKAGLAGLYGIEGVVNVQGESQKKLDVIANDNFVNALTVSISSLGIKELQRGMIGSPTQICVSMQIGDCGHS